MADSAIGITNPRLDSKVVIRYTDKEMWSEAQEFAYVRLTSTRDYKVTRSDTHLVPAVLTATRKMPWSAEALPKIGRFKSNQYIQDAFDNVRKIESLDPVNGKKTRQKVQLDHLFAIAEHEQKIVLQPLIYDDEGFSWWLRRQRKAWVKWASPTLQLVFAAACDIDDPELKSVAPDDMVLEDFKSRFDWIVVAAKKYHQLMTQKTLYMENELKTMAAWVRVNDKAPLPVPPFMP